MKFLRFLLNLNKRLVKELLLLDDVPLQYRRTIGGDNYSPDETDSPLVDNTEPNVIANKKRKYEPK